MGMEMRVHVVEFRASGSMWGFGFSPRLLSAGVDLEWRPFDQETECQIGP
jgi:hypothetical protein